MSDECTVREAERQASAIYALVVRAARTFPRGEWDAFRTVLAVTVEALEDERAEEKR